MRGDADVILVGGRIFTSSRRTPWARTLAVRGDRLVAVGTDAQAERWRGRGTQVVDLRGRVVVPGFIDAHAHMADAAGELGWTRLEGTRSLEAAVRRMRDAALRSATGTWVLGVGWDEAKWPERRYLRREELDRVSTEHPVFAERIDGHVGSLNTNALATVERFRGMPGFELDAAGQPTGSVKEGALAAFRRSIEPSQAAVESGLARIARMAHRLGITSIHDIVDRRAWRAYQSVHRAGTLRIRVYAIVKDPLLSPLAAAGLSTGLGDPWLRLGAIKTFADGSLGARTAALSEPYGDEPENRGMAIHDVDDLRGILGKAHRAGFQTATHAIGDAAIRAVVGVLREFPTDGPRDDRHRIEHYELPDDDVLSITKSSHLIASCQPNFVGQWSGPGGLYEMRLGPERAARNNPYRRILRNRIRLCFGSDGMPYGPLFGIHWAVNGTYEDQRISVEDAVRAYTAGGAYASFDEDRKGTLEAGKLADFVVLDGDPFAEPGRIRRVAVQSTWLGGTPVFRRLSTG